MNSLYNLAARQIAAIRADVEAYSTDPFSGSNNKAQINTAFATLLKTIEDYEGMANRELVVAKREKALGRAANFRSEAKQLRELLSYTDAKNSSRLAASALPTASMTSAPRSRVRLATNPGNGHIRGCNYTHYGPRSLASYVTYLYATFVTIPIQHTQRADAAQLWSHTKLRSSFGLQDEPTKRSFWYRFSVQYARESCAT